MADNKLMSVSIKVDKELKRIKDEKLLASKSAAISYIMDELRKCKEQAKK